MKNNVTKGKRPTDGIRQTVKGQRGIKNKVWLRRRKTEMPGAFGKTCRLRGVVNKHGKTGRSAQGVSHIHGRVVSTVCMVREATSSAAAKLLNYIARTGVPIRSRLPAIAPFSPFFQRELLKNVCIYETDYVCTGVTFTVP